MRLALVAVLVLGCAQAVTPSAPAFTRSPELSTAAPTRSALQSVESPASTPTATESPSTPPVCQGALLEGVLVDLIVEAEHGPQFGVDDDGLSGGHITPVIWP